MKTRSVGRQRHILIVEDNALVAVNEQSLLCREGFICDGAGCLAEAKRHLERQSYDMLILDHHLPDGRGCELLNYVDSGKVDIPVLYTTAADVAELADLESSSLVSAFLRKPFTADDFLSAVRAHCAALSIPAISKLSETGALPWSPEIAG